MTTTAAAAASPAVRHAVTARDIPLTQLRESTLNPRKTYDPVKLEELAASIREKGIFEPLIVRWSPAGDSVRALPDESVYEIVAGSRRFRAALLAGEATVPCIVRELTDCEALEVAVIENGQRVDIGPIEEAQGYEALMKAEKAYTVAVMAAKVGKSESYVYRRLRLLQLEDWLQEALAENRLTVAHAEKLLRLPPKLRKEADDRGLIWHYSPLWRDDNVKPGRDDLAPLHSLEAFIRERTAFAPAAEETKHYQPELQEQMADTLVEGDGLTDELEAAVEAAKAELVELSDDPMCRAKLRAGKSDRIPLTPSKWKAVTSEKQRCEFTIRGIVTHGGPPRVLDVCLAKGKCTKHWPAKKKPKASTATTAKAKQDSWEEQNRKDRERREAERQAWDALFPRVAPALVEHLARVTFNAAVVRQLLGTWKVNTVKSEFGVTLSNDTAVQVLILSQVAHSTHGRGAFLNAVRPWKFNIGAVEQKFKAEQKAAAKAQAKAATSKGTTPAKASARKKAARPRAKQKAKARR